MQVFKICQTELVNYPNNIVITMAIGKHVLELKLENELILLW